MCDVNKALAVWYVNFTNVNNMFTFVMFTRLKPIHMS